MGKCKQSVVLFGRGEKGPIPLQIDSRKGKREFQPTGDFENKHGKDIQKWNPKRRKIKSTPFRKSEQGGEKERICDINERTRSSSVSVQERQG